MNRPADHSSSAAIREAAAEWVGRLDRGLTESEQRAFAEWCARSERHAEEFAQINSSWARLERAGSIRHLEEEAHAVLLGSLQRQRHWKLRLVSRAMFAAAAGVAVFFALRQPPRPVPTEYYQVQASTARMVVLPDGSVVALNGDSRIETDYTTTERRVRLLRGEAHFTVAKNLARPFFVTAGPVAVRAVGTAFNVHFDATIVSVLVTEGKVRMNDTNRGTSLLPGDSSVVDGHEAGLLVAGQRADVRVAAAPAPAYVTPVSEGEVEQALAWRTTRLIFNDTPLAEVASAFNRYNAHKLVLGTSELRSRRITGVFRSDNLDGFVRLLEVGSGLEARPHGEGEIVLSERR